ncbi:unnamed protein product [Ectocarpus sp. 8 AP-2014]
MSSGDRAALVALFRSTGGTRWRFSNNWDTKADLSKWHGVEVNDDGRVVKLVLLSNNLKGTIPDAVGALTELRALYLIGNKLTGPIPEALGALKELAHLGLGDNKLTGSIPAWLGFLKKLQQHGLSRNQLAGPIPGALGALQELTILGLDHNELKGSIPAWLGSLTNLQQLGLHGNELAGPIPEALGALQELTMLGLGDNKLTGSIPAWLGSLKKLQQLGLNGNQLVGLIPEALGALRELRHLYLNDNKLTGPIPETLGALKELLDLCLKDNNLTGSIPTWLGSLSKLQRLELSDNQFFGVIPTELGNLWTLSKFEFGNTGLKTFLRRGNKLTGGPADGEGLDSWRERMQLDQRTKPQTLKDYQKEEGAPVPPPRSPPVLLPRQQQIYEGDEKEEDAPVLLGSPTRGQQVVGESAIWPEHASLSPGKAKEVDRLFRAQLSSSARLDSLIRDKPEALEDIQRVIGSPGGGSFYFDYELSDMERRRKLGTLVTMSTAIGEVVLRHTEDKDIQRKERDLAPFSKAYYAAVRSGLCNAYLAASVIDSDWVSTSKTGRVGKAGATLKLVSSAVPAVGGLPELAGKALETGDHFLQTRRLVKITGMAPDAMECCFLARRLALQLTEGLKDDAGAGADEADHVHVHTTAGMSGGSGSGLGADMMPGDMSEDDVFEYVLEEVASYKRKDHGGKRLGKKHLRKLLKAIQRGCLEGSSCTDQKIEILLLKILPPADIRPAATSSTPKEVTVQAPAVVAAAHDSGLPSMAEFTALQAAVEALTSVKDKQQAELEALKSDKEKQQAKIEAMDSRNKELRDQVATLEKRVPDGDCEPCDTVNAGGGQVLKQKLEIKEDLETFWQRKETAAAARDEGTLTLAEHQVETRDTRARVDDVDDRVDFMEARLAALEQQQAGKKKGFSQRGRRHR